MITGDPIPKLAVLLLALLTLSLAGCATYRPVFTSTERAIWVVRSTGTGEDIYRCVDTAGEGVPSPAPLCVEASKAGPAR